MAFLENCYARLRAVAQEVTDDAICQSWLMHRWLHAILLLGKTGAKGIESIPDDDSPQLLWTLDEVARHLKLDTKAVRKLMADDEEFPRPLRMGPHERWRASDFYAWELFLKFDRDRDRKAAAQQKR
jgi:hypothetical protein